MIRSNNTSRFHTTFAFNPSIQMLWKINAKKKKINYIHQIPSQALFFTIVLHAFTIF